MPTKHRIREGETLIGVAESYGFAPETVWDYPDNAELRAKRKNMNVLSPGDDVVIPDRRLRLEKAATARRHTYRRKGVPAVLRLQIFDGEEPRANQKYELEVGTIKREGTTDGDGVLEEYVPPRARRAKIRFGEELELSVQIGELDPIDTPSGLRQRLTNLGFACGAGDEIDDPTREALRAFQRRFELKATGEADEETIAELEAAHDKTNEFPQPE